MWKKQSWRVIFESFYFWEVISSSILDIIESIVKADDSVLLKEIVEVYDFSEALRRPHPQVYIVS